VCVPVETDSLASLLEGLPGLQLAGFAVEGPYRHDIVAHLDNVDDDGKRCGCAGTVVIKDGRMEGFETDGRAVTNAVPRGFDLSGRSTVILGTGAVARAAALCLSRCGARATLVARRSSRGADRARSIGLTVVSADELDRLPWEVLVNASPATSHSASPVSEACLSRGGLVVDMLPGSQPTPLLAEAQARGCTTVDGNAVLLARCALQLRRWTDIEPPVEDMRRALDRSAEESS
jgi:shikimate dehydrogenase